VKEFLKKQMGQDPKKTPTHARNPEKRGRVKKCREKEKNTEQYKKMNSPRQL